ncbi:efflux RND transporter permease subunit [Pseudogemmatithrix spongiicola]|uniref:Efflux RND transporter permease subunit n=1 Tax=Pseudogemmatithrix spongiicola TaxID=3062599 RepID=A0AA49JSI8_9BACT|nr:efflux RND transporter permease subunit [Gemmatimonadaceae bacterium 'strain 138']WKW14059.1 efflux RND transporter permease subunit [Gemmatimonadaceae bacterium 'strain 318']
MSIVGFSVRNRQFMLVAFVALLATGAFSMLTIPRAEDPTFPIPVFPVVAVYPGASPTDIEQLVVDPIEDRIRALEDLKDVKTSIEDGLAVIVPEFDVSVDADRKYDEILREVNALRGDLPSDLAVLEVQRINAADVNIAQFALVSVTAPYHELDKAARALRDDLARLPGVKKAETWGYPRREVRVALDVGRLAELGIPLTRVLQAVGGESLNIPGGSVDAGNRRFNVKTSGGYRSLEQIRATVIAGAPGSTLRLGDVAEVEWDYETVKYTARSNGKRAVWITVAMQENQNIMAVRDRVWAAADAFEASLPASMTFERPFDQSKNVQARLSRLTADFMIAIALVVLTLLPLGFRASAIVMVSIPLSLAIGVTLLKVFGFSINQLSIVGFVIALGLLVDDSIVVVENIARWLREGSSRVSAAIKGTNQILVAVIGTTATLVFAFLPVMMLPGTAGKFIRSLPAAVVLTIAASLLVSITIIPFLAAMFLKEEGDEHGNVFMRALNRGIDATYGRVLHRALARPVQTLAVAAVLFAGTLALIPSIGFSLFPKAGTPQFLVTVNAPEGSSLTVVDSAVAFAERALVKRESVRQVYANIGRGNPNIYYNIQSLAERSTRGELFVLTREYDPASTPALLDSLRVEFDAYPDARIQVTEFENGPPIDAPVAMRITGDDLDSLRAIAARVERVLDATEGTRDVLNPLRVSRTDLRLRADRAKAGLYGVPTAEVDRAVRLGLEGLVAGRVRDRDGEEYDVTLRLPGPARKGPEVLDRLYAGSVTGAQVPVRQLASLEFETSPPVIQHYDGERAVTVTSQVRTGYNTDRVTRAVLSVVDTLSLPEGYAITAAGEIESRQESFGGLGAAILIATFGILAILILEFKTFRGMLIVSSVIPLGVIGGLVGLWVTGYTLSFSSVIGFVALIGIEIKSSILLVDFTNQLRAEGVGLDDAIERAGKIRFVPIVLTSMTAIGGLIPLAIQGSSLYSPLAIVIIGGLVSSTLLSRLVTPVLYKLLPPTQEEVTQTGEFAVVAG